MGRQRDALQPVDEPALVRLHPVQVEQGVLVVNAVDAGHHFEIDDVALGQFLPIALANAGEHAVRARNAVRAQNIEVHLVVFRDLVFLVLVFLVFVFLVLVFLVFVFLVFVFLVRANGRRLAHVVTGDLLPVFKVGGLQRIAIEIRCIIISSDDQPSDFCFVRADIGVNHEHGGQRFGGG